MVAEVGPGVTSVRVGDRVMMHHYTGCNACSMCRIGYTQMCLVHHEIYGVNQGRRPPGLPAVPGVDVREDAGLAAV